MNTSSHPFQFFSHPKNWPNSSSSQRGPRILAYIHDRGESAFHLHPRRRICIDVLRQIPPPHISRFPLLRSWCKKTKERKKERQKERQKERRRRKERIWIEIHLGSNSCPSIVLVHQKSFRLSQFETKLKAPATPEDFRVH